MFNSLGFSGASLCAQGLCSLQGPENRSPAGCSREMLSLLQLNRLLKHLPPLLAIKPEITVHTGQRLRVMKFFLPCTQNDQSYILINGPRHPRWEMGVTGVTLLQCLSQPPSGTITVQGLHLTLQAPLFDDIDPTSLSHHLMSQTLTSAYQLMLCLTALEKAGCMSEWGAGTSVALPIVLLDSFIFC